MDYTSGSAGAAGAVLATTGASLSSQMLLFVGVLLMAGAGLMLGVSSRRRRHDRAATRR